MPTLESARATEAAFVEDVCLHPGDDAPRLIYADWLDEHGQAERAEFVRVQCELAGWKPYRPPPEIEEIAGSGRLYAAQARELIAEKKAEHEARHGALCRRERELLAARGYGWCDGMFGADWKVGGGPKGQDNVHVYYFNKLEQADTVLTFRRGFVEEITLTAAAFAGEPCRHCEGRGGWPGNVPHCRGRCETCHGTGRTGGHAAALFRAAPIARVTLSDMDAVETNGRYYLTCTRNARTPFDALRRLMTEADRSSREALLAGLCAACLLYGRRAAWPCPECGGQGILRFPRKPHFSRPCPACAGRGHTVEEG